MNPNQLRKFLHIKKLSNYGLVVGITLFISSFFVSGLEKTYFLSIGLSVSLSSMLIFIFSICITLMSEVNRVKHSPAKAKLYLVKKPSSSCEIRKAAR